MASSSSTTPNSAPQPEDTPITFGRFVAGRLERFQAPINDLEYLAISHVWGDPSLLEPRDVPGIEGKVLCTPEKAEYIEHELPKKVGTKPFWMDILTVDQTNKDAVTAITKSIPLLFRNASCTIVLRECDGFYDCCREAVEGFDNYGSFLNKILSHHSSHKSHVRIESYLQRLWTLEECLLSRTVQFTVGPNNTPRDAKDTGDSLNAWYKSQVDAQIICDSLYTLACVFTGSSKPDIVAFLRAYINCSTIRKPSTNQMDKAIDIFDGNLRSFHLSSARTSTKHRDYVLATMPQFPWYTVPIDAKRMSFGEIFQDLHTQASAQGHGFAFKILTSMTDGTAKDDPERAWLPSLNLPEPQCLGDFLKLMGGRMPESALDKNGPLHLTTQARVREWLKNDDPDTVLEAISNTMALCSQYFGDSHSAGELSKYGNFPSLSWDLDDIDAMHFGWLRMGDRNALRILEQGEGTYVAYGGGWDYHEQPDWIYEDFVEIHDGQAQEPSRLQAPSNHGQSDPLLQYARKVLDHMWSGHANSNVSNVSQRSDWEHFRREMYPRWPEPLIRAIMLLAGLIGCGLGLSAAAWANRYFVPVYVGLGKTVVVGLMARHARSPPSERKEPRQFLSVGRHHPSTEGTKAQDNLLVNPETGLAVGMLPDFLPNVPVSDEVYAQRMADLYHGFAQVLPNNTVRILHLPFLVPKKKAEAARGS
ncbi:hypothetical protein INS49_006290 [Diaporthe citri]|uniref:uncharacterized protein n=1 Tax=Diaporthe citri TaxID=83186 RepID=UPI001C8221C1|nr:uncharacterized protein INS49_006290 [Diaporthe citri]KAG6364686.1 hypothetical protein INS49_006290 [Diaporthe citri]